jgi:hypothetical protein
MQSNVILIANIKFLKNVEYSSPSTEYGRILRYHLFKYQNS